MKILKSTLRRAFVFSLLSLTPALSYAARPAPPTTASLEAFAASTPTLAYTCYFFRNGVWDQASGRAPMRPYGPSIFEVNLSRGIFGGTVVMTIGSRITGLTSTNLSELNRNVLLDDQDGQPILRSIVLGNSTQTFGSLQESYAVAGAQPEQSTLDCDFSYDRPSPNSSPN